MSEEAESQHPYELLKVLFDATHEDLPLGGGLSAATFAETLRDRLTARMQSHGPGMELRRTLSPLLGFDPGSARFYTGVAAADAARGLSAQAFTIGSDVFFGAGKFAPQTEEGLALIAHELTHVGQQSRGSIRRKAILDDGEDAHEREAKLVAARMFLRGGTALSVQRAELLTIFEDEDDAIASNSNHVMRLFDMAVEMASELVEDTGRSLCISNVEVEFEIDLHSDPRQLAQEWAHAIVAAINCSAITTVEQLSPPAPSPLVQRCRKRKKGSSSEGEKSGSHPKKKAKSPKRKAKSPTKRRHSTDSEKEVKRPRKGSRGKNPEGIDLGQDVQERDELVHSKRRGTRQNTRKESDRERVSARSKKGSFKFDVDSGEEGDEELPNESPRKKQPRESIRAPRKSTSKSTKDLEDEEGSDPSQKSNPSSKPKKKKQAISRSSKGFEEQDGLDSPENSPRTSKSKGMSGSGKSTSRSRKESDNEDEASSSEHSEKPPRKRVDTQKGKKSKKVEPKPPEEDPHYSSEDDISADQEEFDAIHDVAVEVRRQVRKALPEKLDIEKAKQQVKRIQSERTKAKSGKLPVNFGIVEFEKPVDWYGFAIATRLELDELVGQINDVKEKYNEDIEGEKAKQKEERQAELKLRREQIRKEDLQRKKEGLDPLVRKKLPRYKRPKTPTEKIRDTEVGVIKRKMPSSYTIKFNPWKGAHYNLIPNRNEVKRPVSERKLDDFEKGRPWYAIARSLEEASQMVARKLVDSDDDIASTLGNRVLATAILYIFAGEGDQVRAALLESGFTAKEFQSLEYVILEYMALALGIESVRRPFMLVDALLHIANIAGGKPIRPSVEESAPYRFESAYSGIRDIEGERKHVYAPLEAKGGTYKGYTVAKNVDHVLTPYLDNTPLTKGAQDKKKPRKKAPGKAIASQSAQHEIGDKYLKKDKEVYGQVFDQIKSLEGEERRKVHEDRWKVIGGIRIHNLVGNVVKSRLPLTGQKSSVIGKQLGEAMMAYLQGQKSSTLKGNLFHDVFPDVPGVKFADALDRLILSESARAIKQDETAKLLQRKKVKETSKRKIAKKEETTSRMPITEKMLRAALQSLEEPVDEVELPKSWAKAEELVDTDEEPLLTNEQVETLLFLANLPQTTVTSAAEITQTPHILAEVIHESYQDQLTNHGGLSTYTVVPINIRNAHWATLVIQQNLLDHFAPNVYFVDSMGQNEGAVAILQQVLAMSGVVGPNAIIQDLSLEDMQEDAYTCGTWCVEVARTIIESLETGQDIEEALGELGDMKNLHQQNVNLVQVIAPDLDDEAEDSEDMGSVVSSRSSRSGSDEDESEGGG